ncbi:M15 family metallopeptidase [Lagierella sp. ICN-221743]
MSKRRKSFRDINEKYSFLDQGVDGLKNRNVTRDEESRQRTQRSEEYRRRNSSSEHNPSYERNQNFRDHTIKMDPKAIEQERRRLQHIAMKKREEQKKKKRMITVGVSIIAVLILALLLKSVLDAKNKKNIAGTDPANIVETVNSNETTSLKGFVLVTKSAKYYQESNTSSTELGEIAAGEYLENYGVTNGFNKVRYNGIDGYIESSNLSTVNNPDQLKVIKGILVVNNQYSLPEDFQPGMNVQAKTNFDIMARKAKNDGIIIKIASDFRSYEQQKTNGYTDGVSAFGEYMADGSQVEPGKSEHQTGLAFDVVGEDYENKYNDNFQDSKEYKWLVENAHKYGFIIRYPKDKENITGRKFEPWHIRFVEPTVADEMHRNNLCLEEYLGLAKVSKENNLNTNEENDNQQDDTNQDTNEENDNQQDDTNQDTNDDNGENNNYNNDSDQKNDDDSNDEN